MLKIPLGPDDSFLILAPRFADLGTAGQIGLLALFLLIPLGLIVWLYRYELRLVSRLAACALMAIRLLMLLLIWVAVGLQPYFAEIREVETPSRVRVAVDLSSSMEVADVQRLPEEWDSLAAALKLGEDDKKMSRKAIAGRLMASDAGALLARLAEHHRVEIVGFHRHALKLDEADLLQQLEDPEAAPKVDATDFLQALAKASTSADDPLLGIVLLSDGQHNVGPPPFSRAEELGKQGTPIFPVVIGSRRPPPDLVVLDVQAPTQAFKNATIPVEIRVKAVNLPAQELTVEMQLDGQAPLPEHRSILQHNGKDTLHNVRFQATLAEAGTHIVTVKAISKTGAEVTLENNSAARIIRVADDKAKILLVDGEARWEYHYLATALARDPAIHLERVVFSQPRIGAIEADKLDKAGLPKLKLSEAKEKAPDPLLDFDCILLGDVGPEDFPLAERKRLERFVNQRGGTLILVAGKRSMPLAYKDDADPLAKMLPITEARELKPEAGFTLGVSGEGNRRPFLNLEPNQAGFAWPELPRHFWGIVGQRKAGASVLMTPVLDESVASKDTGEIGIVVQQNYGFGRVLFVGIDSTWRWRFRVGDAYHHRFWGQLARWSAAEKLLPAGNRLIRFGPREPAYLEGQEIELAARLGVELPKVDGDIEMRAVIHRKKPSGGEEKVAVAKLVANAAQPNLLEAKVRDLPAGEYRMELDIPHYRAQLAEQDEEKNAPVKGADQFRVLPRQHGEWLDLSTNWELMQSLSDRSGGKLFTPENASDIVERLQRRIEVKETRSEIRPWQDAPAVWWFFGLLLLLLVLEWGWRKRLDLP